MALQYQASQLPALSPAIRKIASRLGSNANSSAYFAAAGRRRSQLFHTLLAAALDPISQRPSQRGALVGELVDGILD
jgi:hypothetical protein